MLRNYIKHHLEGVIAAYFTAIIIVLTLVLGIAATTYVYHQTSQTLLQNVELLLQEKVDVVKNRITQIHTVQDILVSEDSDFVSLICSEEKDHLKQIYNYLDASSILKHYMSICLDGQYVENRSENYFAVLYGKSDFLISRVYPQNYSEDINGVEIRSEKEVIDKDWYDDVKENVDKMTWIEFDSDQRLRGAVYIRQYIANEGIANVQDVGILHFGFSCGELFEGLASNPLTENTLITIYADQTPIYTTAEDDHVKSYSYRYQVSDGLYIGYEIPRENIWGIIKDYILIMLAAIAVFLFAGVWVVIRVSRVVVAPILKLSNHMSKGEITEIKEWKGEDEINQIYKSYNQMVQKIKALIIQIRHTEEEQRNTEIRLLQAQINPHFIYNTLDTVGCGLLENGEDELAQCVSDLADFIRYNLRDSNNIIELEHEMAMIHNYLHIRRIQSTVPIEYKEEIEESCLKAVVPKMMVQPLVENAIEHGAILQNGYNKIWIELKAEYEQNNLVITIKNSGATTTEEDINDQLKGTKNISRKGSGLGIRNVHERMKKLYGDKYGLAYTITKDYTKVKATIPFCIK